MSNLDLARIQFAATTFTMGAVVLSLFIDLYPRVMLSSTNPAHSLTAGH